MRETRLSKTAWEKVYKVGDLTMPDSKTYCKAIVTKAGMLLVLRQTIHQTNRIHGQSIFIKGTKMTIYWGRDILFNK